ncbi:MAG: flavin reductase family protein [Eubacteriales bacterium]|nr:flavin reductase family protein [Eubacteriales bacterium]
MTDMKRTWKPGNMVYPVPAVLVSVGRESGETNMFTVAWVGNVCTDPPMLSISVRQERYSNDFIEENGEFVVNLTTEKLAWATDFCGVRSGRDVDKWKECGLTPMKASELSYAPLIKESPVNIECRVSQRLELGSHIMYLAEVLSVHVDEAVFDETGKADLAAAGLIAYSHGEYVKLEKTLGTFGYSVRKKPKKPKKSKKKRSE